MIKFSDMLNESLEGSGSKFKLGLDIHGVCDSMPELFSFLTDSFIKNGGEVHIITGGHWNDDFESLLNSLGVKWTHKFSVYDYLIESGSKITGEIQFPDGTIQKKFENEAWDGAKSNYCRENNISLHIDDTLIYNNFFTTPFARLWTHSNNPKASHKDVRHID
jgi:hypothetical protein